MSVVKNRTRNFRAALQRRLESATTLDSLVLIVAAVLIGAATGLGAVIFIWMMRQVAQLTDWLTNTVLAGLPHTLALVLVMGVAGLIVGVMVTRWAKEAKGHGVPEVMEAIAVNGGRIRPRVAAVKVLASSITIGSGGSAGREGPIVQVGSALGSSVGQWLKLSEDQVKTLVACGSAAGIAATFNAPIAGAIFALEVVLGRFTTRYFGAVVLGSVAAAVVGQSMLGDKPAFTIPTYSLNSLGELPIYLILGLLAALVAVLFIRVLYFTEDFFDNRLKIYPVFKTAIGLALTGLLGSIYFGHLALGPGLDFIGDTIASDFDMPVNLLAGLLLVKLLATSLTLGSGNSGGVFAPSLFMGAILGGIVGTIANTLWPEVAVHPGAYAIVGMAAVFAGAARAPITAVLIVFEMSNDYKLILPLMMATVISVIVAEHIFSESIYTFKLRLKGITLQSGRDLDIMQGIVVREAMTTPPYVVDQKMSLDQLGGFFQRTHGHSFPVVDDQNRLVGMVSIQDYDRALGEQGSDGRVVADIATMNELLVAYEEEPLSNALQRIAIRGVNKLPVVSRADPSKVVGVIRRRDIIGAYKTALGRRARDQASQDQMALRHIDNTEFLEVEIPVGNEMVNRPLATLSDSLPHECVVVSIRRQGMILIPHGDTVLQAGDQLNFFLRKSDEQRLKDCFKPPDLHPDSRFE